MIILIKNAYLYSKLYKFKTQHHCRYCTGKKMKKKINLKLKTLEINKMTLKNKINKLGIEIYSIIQ